MIEEYEDQGPRVDEVNDLGNALDAMTSSGERPLSPIRRLGRESLKSFFYSRINISLCHSGYHFKFKIYINY